MEDRSARLYTATTAAWAAVASLALESRAGFGGRSDGVRRCAHCRLGRRPPREGSGLNSLVHQFTRRRMSADVGNALLGVRLGSGRGPRWKREDGCVLPFIESRQQHDLAIGELKRVMIGVKRALVDLAKDRNGVAGIGSKHEGSLILDWLLERQLGARKYADSHRTILRCGESSSAGAEVVCDELFTHFGWACSHHVQTVIAHIKELLTWSPP